MPQPADPLRLAHGPTWRNSIALAPLTNCQSNADGTLSDDEVGAGSRLGRKVGSAW